MLPVIDGVRHGHAFPSRLAANRIPSKTTDKAMGSANVFL
jgi:hypothetical protein